MRHAETNNINNTTVITAMNVDRLFWGSILSDWYYSWNTPSCSNTTTELEKDIIGPTSASPASNVPSSEAWASLSPNAVMDYSRAALFESKVASSSVEVSASLSIISRSVLPV